MNALVLHELGKSIYTYYEVDELFGELKEQMLNVGRVIIELSEFNEDFLNISFDTQRDASKKHKATEVQVQSDLYYNRISHEFRHSLGGIIAIHGNDIFTTFMDLLLDAEAGRYISYEEIAIKLNIRISKNTTYLDRLIRTKTRDDLYKKLKRTTGLKGKNDFRFIKTKNGFRLLQLEEQVNS